MSSPTLAPPTSGSGDWDDFLQFAAIVADFRTQPLGEPLPEPEVRRAVRQRPARKVERAEAIAVSLERRRHRSREREA